jgi:transcriptional regulator with XRE-family HTH domain
MSATRYGRRMPFSTFEVDADDGPIIGGARWLGQAVRQRRRVLGVTQRQLENVTGIDQTIISRLETGRLKGIKHARLLLLIGTLGGLDLTAPPPRMTAIEPRGRIDLDDSTDDEAWMEERPRPVESTWRTW